MALKIYDTMVPQGDYPAVKAEHVQMPDGTKLSDLVIQVVTQEEYDALVDAGTVNDSVLYLIKEV